MKNRKRNKQTNLKIILAVLLTLAGVASLVGMESTVVEYQYHFLELFMLLSIYHSLQATNSLALRVVMMNT
jgi:hypothetical protein